MDVLSIVAPVFALIVLGFAASYLGLLSDGSHKALSEFAFGLAVPCLLLRTIATAEFPAVSPIRIWAAYFGAGAATWILASVLTAIALRRPVSDGATIAMGSVYGNIVMLGIPLNLATFGPAAAGPMALILAVNTPLLWLFGTLQMGWGGREAAGGGGSGALALRLVADLARNPIVIGIALGFALRATGLGLPALAEKVLSLVGQAGVPTSLVALGASLRHFRIQGQLPTLTLLCVLKLFVMPAIAWWLAFAVFELPPVAAGVVVLFAAMPAGANVFIFAQRYQRVVNSASGAVAVGSLISVLTASALITVLLRSVP